MRLIDAEALEKEGWILQRKIRKDNNYFIEKMNIQDVPTVNTEEKKRGQWIETGEFWKDREKCEEIPIYKCSFCGQKFIGKPQRDYCLYCGSNNK